MPRSRTCPHCTLAAHVEEGYNFDAEGNLLCPKCGKILYPVTLAAETDVDTGIKSRTGTAHGSVYPRYDAWTGQNRTYADAARPQAATAVDDDEAV
jgi:hypothetical protein